MAFLFERKVGVIRIMIEHAGGMFIARCAHRAIPLFSFPRPRGKLNARESLHLRQNRQVILIELPACSFCAMISADGAEGLSAPLEHDRQTDRQIGICRGELHEKRK